MTGEAEITKADFEALHLRLQEFERAQRSQFIAGVVVSLLGGYFFGSLMRRLARRPA